MTDIRQQMTDLRICVIVPTYNNAGTIVDVLRRILTITCQVIVVVDGCTDDTRERLQQLAHTGIDIVDYTPNRGKGRALVEGFKRAINKGYEYAITIDSDGQHYPEDIPLFVQTLSHHPHSLIVGSRNLQEKNMPGGNTFANKFSNFWFKLQTGISLPDTQTGYRLYPLNRLAGTQWITSRYEAELELLIDDGLDAFFVVDEVTPASFTQHIERAVTEKAVKVLPICSRMTGEVLTLLMAEVGIFFFHPVPVQRIISC